MIVFPVETFYQGVYGLQKGIYDVTNQDIYVFPGQGEVHKAEFRPPGFPRMVLAGSQENMLCAAKNIVFLDGRLYALKVSESVLKLKPSPDRTIELQVIDIGSCDWSWRSCCKWSQCAKSKCQTGRDLLHAHFLVACNAKIYAFNSCEVLHGHVFDPYYGALSEIEAKIERTSVNVKRCRPDDFRAVVILNNEIYVPVKNNTLVLDSRTDKWRKIPNVLDIETMTSSKNFNCRCYGNYLYSSTIVVKEEMYIFSAAYIHVYNRELNSWTQLDGNFMTDFREDCGMISFLYGVVGYQDEVVGLLRSPGPGNFVFANGSSHKFCKSVGCGIRGKKLTWEDFPGPSLDGICKRVIDQLDQLQYRYIEL